MRRLLITTIIMAQLICSCTTNGDTSSVIDLDKNDKVSIFDLVDSISVVQLETTHESLFKRAKDIIFHKNRYYLFDWELQAFFCFDSKGKFLYKLNKRGRGADEYDFVGDFNINKYNDQLMLVVPWGTILYYDLDGNFISKVKLPGDLRAYNEIYALDNDHLLFITWSHEYKAYTYSRSSGKILKGSIPTTEELCGVFPPFGLSYYYKDSLYFNNAGVKNQVINMSDPNPRVSYSWDFGDKNYTEKQINKAILYKQKMRQERKPSLLRKDMLGDSSFPNYYVLRNFETNRFRGLFLTYKIPDDLLYVFKDKNDGKDIVFRETIEGVDFSSYWICDNAIISVSNKDNSTCNKVLSSEQLKIVESQDPDNDNPFLVIYHLK